MPSSFYATLISFAIFFACLNIYILTSLLDHPLASDLWIIGTIAGFGLLLYSIRMVRIQQRELIETKELGSK
jgi:phosphate/sulfate permease